MNMKAWSYLPNPFARAGYDTRSILKRSLTGLNSEFSFSETSCLTKAEEISLPYYLPIAEGRIIGFIPFPRVLVLCEMQSVRSRIWTRVAVSISCDDNHYTTGTSMKAWLEFELTTMTQSIALPGFNPRSAQTKTSKNGTCCRFIYIKWGSRVKWSNPGNEVATSPTPRCSSYWKGSPSTKVTNNRT